MKAPLYTPGLLVISLNHLLAIEQLSLGNSHEANRVLRELIDAGLRAKIAEGPECADMLTPLLNYNPVD